MNGHPRIEAEGGRKGVASWVERGWGKLSGRIPEDWAGVRAVCLGLALITLVEYLPAGRHGFVLYDDPDYISENRVVQAGLTWRGVGWAFSTWRANNWHPLTWLSHMADCEVFGLDAGAHHMVSVVIHAINGALVLVVFFRMTGAFWTSALVAALFAWHPLHTESVAWASERKDVLSGLFGLLALGAYARYADASRLPAADSLTQARGKGKISAGVSGGLWEVSFRLFSRFGAMNQSKAPSPPAPLPSDGRGWPVGGVRVAGSWENATGRFYALALVWFAFGLMAKPMLVTWPFLFLVMDYWPLRRTGTSRRKSEKHQGNRDKSWRGLIWEKWPFFALSAGSCVITFLAQRQDAVVGLDPYPLNLRLANAVVAYARYLLKAVWPGNLAVIYPLPLRWPASVVTGSLALLGGISWLAWRSRKESPHRLSGWLWFVGTLVPVIGLVQVGGQAMADRYSYLPLVGIFYAVAFEGRAWALRFPGRRWMGLVAAGVGLALCLSATARQLGYWQDSETLFAHAISVTKANAIAHANLGVAYEEQGRVTEAIAECKAALSINPRLPEARNNLGHFLDEAGKPDEALVCYEETLRLKPRSALAHANLATVLMKLGQEPEARQHYEEAARLAPEDPRPHYAFGKVLLSLGRSGEAVPYFRRAIETDPDHVGALTQLARILSSDPRGEVRDGRVALDLAGRANALTGGSHALVLDTLGMAYAEVGRFKDAQDAVRRAIEIAGNAGDRSAAEAMGGR